MIFDMKKSGGRIQRLRIQHGYTQEEFAKKLNIDRSNLSHIESGRRGCSLDLLVQLSSIFGVTLDYIVFGQDKPDWVTVDSRERIKADLEQISGHQVRLSFAQERNPTVAQQIRVSLIDSYIRRHGSGDEQST